MDAEKKTIEIVQSLIQVVDELSENADLSASGRRALDRAKSEAWSLQSQSDAEALE